MIAILAATMLAPQPARTNPTYRAGRPALARKAGGEIATILGVDTSTVHGNSITISGRMTVFVGMGPPASGSASAHHLIRAEYSYRCLVRGRKSQKEQLCPNKRLRVDRPKFAASRATLQLIQPSERLQFLSTIQHPPSPVAGDFGGKIMNLRKWGLIALGFALGAIGTAPAAAQSAVALERSGNTFHKAVCARGNPNRTARCHAHVVTDTRGNEIDGQARPNATPSGFDGPSDLRSAYAVTANGTTTIAIVDAYGYSRAETDLAKYRSQYGLPPAPRPTAASKRSIRTAGRNIRATTPAGPQDRA